MNLQLQAAKNYLDDRMLEVRRARWLYVDIARHRGDLPAVLRGDLPPEHSLGYFEPIRLFFCWADLLGALYSGDGSYGNKRRVTAWLVFMGGKYAARAVEIHDTYRNDLAHSDYPKCGALSYDDSGTYENLADVPTSSGRTTVCLNIPILLADLIGAVERYKNNLSTSGTGPGTLPAFNNAMSDLRC